MNRRIMSVMLCLVLLMATAVCAHGEDEAFEVTKRLTLGNSPFAIVVDESYQEGDMTEEDLEEGQVGYFFSENAAMDFDVYQVAKDGLPDTLAAYVTEEAAWHEGVTEVVRDGEINGIPVAWYRAVQEYEDSDYDTITYVLDAGEDYITVVFWLDDDEASAAADEAIHSLMEDRPLTLPLGTSGLSIILPAGFREGGMTDEDMAAGLLGYYFSDNTLMDLDVYQIARQDPSETLNDFVAAAAPGDEGDGNGEINGVPAAWYHAVETFEEGTYDTLTYVLDNGGDFMKLVFWLDGETARQEAEDIMQTLAGQEAEAVEVEG